jgi:hypothetical protein
VRKIFRAAVDPLIKNFAEPKPQRKKVAGPEVILLLGQETIAAGGNEPNEMCVKIVLALCSRELWQNTHPSMTQ